MRTGRCAAASNGERTKRQQPHWWSPKLEQTNYYIFESAKSRTNTTNCQLTAEASSKQQAASSKRVVAGPDEEAGGEMLALLKAIK